MTSQEIKDMVTRTWELFCNGDLKSAFSNMSDDVSWLAPGHLPELSGLHEGKSGILKFMRKVGSVFPQGLKMEIRKTYCDGNTVVMELVDFGKVSNGKTYENDLCFVFEVNDGKIHRIREYSDTQKAADIILS